MVGLQTASLRRAGLPPVILRSSRLVHHRQCLRPSDRPREEHFASSSTCPRVSLGLGGGGERDEAPGRPERGTCRRTRTCAMWGIVATHISHRSRSRSVGGVGVGDRFYGAVRWGGCWDDTQSKLFHESRCPSAQQAALSPAQRSHSTVDGVMRSVSLRQRRLFVFWWIQVLILTTAPVAQPVDELGVGIFSDLTPGALPADWKPLRFPSIDEDTAYSLVEAG